MISILDPIVPVRTPGGVSRVGLDDVIDLAHGGDLLDLPSVRADQRAAVVTTLAILSSVLRRYAAPGTSWRDIISDALGDSIVLCGGDPARPAFLQPVIPMDACRPLDMTEVDHLMPATRHVIKTRASVPADEALVALMASTSRPYGGVGHGGGARARLLTVTVGDGVTIGSEIVALATAYDRTVPTIVGSEASPTCALDHMLWAQPWADRQPVPTVPFPFIDCRPIRLVEGPSGTVHAVKALAITAPRVDTGTGYVDDPHTARKSDGGVLRLGKGIWSHVVQHAAIAGSDTVGRPRVLDLAGPFTQVRVDAIGSDNGVTLGHWSALYRVAHGRAVRLGPPAAGDRLATLSAMALAAVSRAQKDVWAPAMALHDGRTVEGKALAKRVATEIGDVAGLRTLQVILDRVADASSTEDDAAAIEAVIDPALWAAWRRATASLPQIPTARATEVLMTRRQTRQEDTAMGTDTTDRVERVLREISAHLTPAAKARLRATASGQLPLAGYVALADVPQEWLADDSPLWEMVVRSLATLSPGGGDAAWALGRTGYPELRMDALMAAKGDALHALIAEAVRWLVSHDVDRASLANLITLATSSLTRDRTEAVRAIALLYVRGQRSAARAA